MIASSDLVTGLAMQSYALCWKTVRTGLLELLLSKWSIVISNRKNHAMTDGE